MATNEREVSLRISAKADGNDQIRALAAEIDKLAKEGGEAAPAFQALAKQLNDIGNQQALIQNFADLKKKTVEAEAAFKAATAATSQAAAALREKKTALDAARASEQASNQSLTEAKAKLEQNRAALAATSAELKSFREAAKASGGATAEQSAAIGITEGKVKAYRDAVKLARDEIRTLAPAQKESATAARQAAQGVSESARAFDSSKRAAQSAKTEYERNTTALQGLRNSLQSAGVSTTNLAEAQRKATADSARLTTEATKLRDAQKQAGDAAAEAGRKSQEAAAKTASAAGQATASIRGLAAPLAAAFGAQQFIDANVALENTARTLTAITGSGEKAAQEMEFLRGVADRLGLDVIDASRAYSSLIAATKGTGVEGQKTREVFESVAQAMSVAGKSSAETEGALQALSQMASKGVVSMEELRQQLGERLPGAMQSAAAGLGLTTKELGDLVATGQLTADELFPALAKGLNDLYGASNQSGKATETLTQEWNHFKNALAEGFKTIGDAGVVKALNGALEVLGGTLTVLSTGVVAAGKTLGTFFAALANGDIGLRGFSDTARQAFADIEKEAQDKLVKAAQHNSFLAATLDENGKNALETSRAQASLASETKRAGDAAAASAPGWTKLNIIYGDLEKKTAAASEQAIKSAEARKAEGDAAVAAANAFGTESQKRDAVAKSAADNAAALNQVAASRRVELGTAQSHLAALQQEILLNGSATEAQKKTVEELRKQIDARQAVADKAIAQAAAGKLAADQAAIESAVYADNSARLDELRNAYEAATSAKQAGATATKTQADLDREAAIAATLYRDAIQDQQAAIQAKLSAEQAAGNLAERTLQLDIELIRSKQEQARAEGDHVSAIEYGIQIKKLEVQIAQLRAEAMRREADAQLKLVEAKREELRAAGQLTAVKAAELNAAEAAAKSKQVEADIADVLAERLEKVTQRSNDAAEATIRLGNAAEIGAEGFDKMANAADRAANAASGAAASSAASKGGSGGNIGSGGSIDWAAALAGRGIELNKEQLDRFRSVIGDEMSKAQGRNKGRTGDATQLMNTILEQAMQGALSEVARNSNDAIRTTEVNPTFYRGNPTFDPRGLVKTAEREQAAKSVNVTVNLGGSSKRINVASDQDAANLIDILKQAESRTM